MQIQYNYKNLCLGRNGAAQSQKRMSLGTIAIRLRIHLENVKLAVHTAGVLGPPSFGFFPLPFPGRRRFFSFFSWPRRIHSPWWPRGSLSTPRWFFSKGRMSWLLLFLGCWFNFTACELMRCVGCSWRGGEVYLTHLLVV